MSLSLRSIKVGYETLRVVAFGAIPAAYNNAAAGGGQIGGPLLFPARGITLQNLTNAALDFSISSNGLTDQLYLPAQSAYEQDYATNQSFNNGFFLPAGTQLFVRYDVGAPTAGNVYLTVFYGADPINI